MADTSVKQQIVDILKDSTNILVTVNANPSVDELSAALGITLLINKMNKHATAVYSGLTPPAIGFLEPEKTFENTVDSLRDFIIALDKEKADHLRYKVEGDVVKIFITPYRTVINQNDLDFSQGDYNVDMVIAIGVTSEDELDKALSSHGRILHDAAVVSLNVDGETKLGTVNWNGQGMSSYSEMLEGVASLIKGEKKVMDEQIATAFLTGIVAATDRFSNSRTSSDVMSAAARLMGAGANQQLIATKLEEHDEIHTSPQPDTDYGRTLEEMEEGRSEKIDRSEPSDETETMSDDGTVGSLAISHERRGTLDEIAEQVAKENQQRAAEKAEEELAKQQKAEPVAAVQESAPSEVSSERDKDELLASKMSIAPPSLNDQSALEELRSGLEYEAAEPRLQGPVSIDQWQKPQEAQNEPSFGGTLNATTEQAAEDKQRELAADRNRTILSHTGSGYVSDSPQYQAPLNATVQGKEEEPTIRDSLSDTAATSHAEMIQPPSPLSSAPTLADIEKEARGSHDDALSAVHEAFENNVNPQPPAPSFGMTPPTGGPALPPLPPMPDFTTLPPLPTTMQSQIPPSFPSIDDNPLGETLPPAAPMPSAPQSTDPGQFKIPGQ